MHSPWHQWASTNFQAEPEAPTRLGKSHQKYIREAGNSERDVDRRVWGTLVSGGWMVPLGVSEGAVRGRALARERRAASGPVPLRVKDLCFLSTVVLYPYVGTVNWIQRMTLEIKELVGRWAS